MKICQQCDSRFEQENWCCPNCQYIPESKDGYMIFSQNSVRPSEGFNPESFQKLFELEPENFWFKVRNELISWSINKYFAGKQSFFEIGCGTAYVLSRIESDFPEMQCSGSEYLDEGLKYAHRRLKRASLWHMDARNIPFENEFDIIGAFDVIEHIAEDREVLLQMHRAVRSGGGIVLTVPQHPFLWSAADEYACHQRRYRARELKNKVQEAGFRVVRMTSFVSFLMPLMMVSRLFMRTSSDGHDQLSELNMNRGLNWVLERILRLESVLIKRGVSFPFGGSLLLVAYKA